LFGATDYTWSNRIRKPASIGNPTAREGHLVKEPSTKIGGVLQKSGDKSPDPKGAGKLHATKGADWAYTFAQVNCTLGLKLKQFRHGLSAKLFRTR